MVVKIRFSAIEKSIICIVFFYLSNRRKYVYYILLSYLIDGCTTIGPVSIIIRQQYIFCFCVRNQILQSFFGFCLLFVCCFRQSRFLLLQPKRRGATPRKKQEKLQLLNSMPTIGLPQEPLFMTAFIIHLR